MDLYVIRHPKVINPNNICYGQIDIPFIELSEVEKQGLQNRFKLLKTDTIYSSPSMRCRFIAELFGQNIKYDQRLKEINFGEWEGIAWDDIAEEKLSEWAENIEEYVIPGGESFGQMIERVRGFMHELNKKDYKNVLLVTHAGVIRILYHLIETVPIRKIFDMKIPFNEILKIKKV